MKTALILGSSGLVGSHLLQVLLNDPEYDRVICIVRKESLLFHPKLKNITSEFDPDADLGAYDRIDTLFSCLGTTRKKTPDLAQYRSIEIDIPMRYAKHCLAKGLQQVHYISAIGVKPGSRNFYIRIKSEAEEALKQAGIPRLHIYQPAFLIGDRNESRIWESIFVKIVPAMDLFLGSKSLKYHSAKVDVLAAGMARIDAENKKPGTYYYTYPDWMK